MEFDLSKKDIKELLEMILSKPSAGINKKAIGEKEWEGGKKYLTKSGIKVRSKIEKIIADIYHDLGIKFEYEKKLKFPKSQNPSESFTVYCDFYLTDYGVYHEHFGLEDKDYTDLKDIKKKAFFGFKLKFFYTEPNDENDIKEAIIRKLGYLGFIFE